ncbi:sulfotransferase family 2 domain-containing protein [Palleronia sp. KMU-117]|uniref:sulfotransferase family 2 domain-containing protein n=1 Tax=Palleronia sp. KMU-117 TaxID=3434108 RepID=UPI003D71D56B
MIISPRHGFVFVHVPKCAGTSVRTQIATCDPDHIALANPGTHPVLGRIDYGHIPLTQLREHFPTHYDYLERFPAFAVIRDPLSRFGSSVRQLLWQYERTPMTMIPPEVLRTRVLEVIDQVADEVDAPSAPMIFFARQRDFVFDGARRMVDHLVPIEHVADLVGYLSRKTGTPMDPDRRSNQNVDLRAKWLGPLAYDVNDALRRRLPPQWHDRIKSTAVRLLASRKSAAETSGILDLPEVRSFVSRTYADDLALYRQARTEAPALIAGFKSGDLPSEAKAAG